MLEKRSYKVLISPDNMGDTAIGIKGYRRQVMGIVENWMLGSKYREEIVGDEKYSIAVYLQNENEVMDFVLSETGELIEGKH